MKFTWKSPWGELIGGRADVSECRKKHQWCIHWEAGMGVNSSSRGDTSLLSDEDGKWYLVMRYLSFYPPLYIIYILLNTKSWEIAGCKNRVTSILILYGHVRITTIFSVVHAKNFVKSCMMNLMKNRRKNYS